MPNRYLDPNWGHCEGCKWWQNDSAGEFQRSPGLCQQPEIVHFQLQVSGESGCNRFTDNDPTEVVPSLRVLGQR